MMPADEIEANVWRIYFWIKSRMRDKNLDNDKTLLDGAEAIGCCNTLLAFIEKYKED